MSPPPSSRLTSLLPSIGGGLQPRKGSGKSSTNSGKSLLGLDRLAASKRNENEQKSKKNYRKPSETPSHPGGLNREAVERTQRQARSHRYNHREEEDRRRRRRRQEEDYDDSEDDDYYQKKRRRRRDDKDYDKGEFGRSSRSYSKEDGRRSDSNYRRKTDCKSSDRDRHRRRSDGGDSDNSTDGRRERHHHPDRHREYDNDNYGRKHSESRPPSSYGDDRHRRAQSSNYNRNYRNNRNSMPPPASRAPVTPSTHASGSTTSMRRGRHSDNVHAPTPMSRSSFSLTPSIHSNRRNNHNNSNRRDNPSANRGRKYRTSRSDWDSETPLQGPRDGSPDIPEPTNEDSDDSDFDRQFYDNEEDGRYLIDQAADGNDMGRFLFDNSKTKAREEEMAKRRQQQGRSERFNARRSALQKDQEAWEESRLLSSGAAVRSSIDLDAEDEKDMSRVTLLVHQVKPPFLSDDKVSFSTVREAVPTVKDASSDFAKMSRAGSATLRYIRANKDKNAMRQKFWELGGTRMGDAVGVAKEKGEEAKNEPNDEDENGEIDYKKSSGFAQHVKKKDGDEKNGAVSKFAKTKTIREQREYLPVFSVRDELMNVIRENSVVVIVGETGSGKVSFFSNLWVPYCSEEH